ncbi:MAG: septal ring lytic transglycosylase RlpA family protein [Candidatus Krumholzibacteria bacterium]|nr:septal ring lytic transglycosylase RlpA family protein [Candidatus Krumholzibacteria bacterium]
MRLLRTMILLISLTVLAACAGSTRDPAEVGGVTSQETGLASYYGHQYHGRTTANGETYDENAMTAAHRTLPFGTRVRVTNLENGKEVLLRINDRGPFVEGRIIDVSWRAAQDLDFVQEGVVKARVEVLPGR